MAVKPAEFDPEEPVVEAVREGDRFAFAELVRRHEQWVRGVIFGVLGDPDRTEDVSQQAWLVFWQRIGELRDVKRWRPWLYRLAEAGRQAGSAGLQAQRPADPAHEVGSENRVTAPDIVAVAERSIERSSFAEILIPRLRIVAARLHVWDALEVGFFGVDAEQHMHALP